MARENYGIDAPGAVRTLGGIGPALLAAALLARPGLPLAALRALRPTLLGTALWMLAFALWMLVSSLWLKRVVANHLLGMRAWRGDEAVLDVGCGRGLLAIGAARRLTTGSVYGVDLWQGRDLSGNTADRARANAAVAQVADRVTIDTGDMRALPYPDARFDVVVSMTAIHNVPGSAERARSVAEIWRVTKPGGQILIFDIRHARTYARQLKRLGAVDVRLRGPILLWGPLGWRFSATKPL